MRILPLTPIRAGTAACAVFHAALCSLGLFPDVGQTQEVSLGGFIPFVGIGLTDEYKLANDATFFLADGHDSVVGAPLSGSGAPPFYDLALLDSGAATHILTSGASGPTGFNINGNGFDGTQTQQVGGATGLINLRINDPLAIFAAGLADSSTTANGNALQMNTAHMRGQSSVATLSAPTQWKLPNILGLPMLAHHSISIRNDQPQIFSFKGRTVRSPDVDFIEKGTGSSQGILRRADLAIRPGASFVAGPLFVFNTDILGGNLEFHENPASPTVIENGALFLDVDLANGEPIFPGASRLEHELQDVEFLFDTGADFTVVSQLTAKRLGFDALVDQPDFVLEVEGSGGVSSGIPGFFVETLNVDTVGGSFKLHNVPLAVLDVTNPNDPGNIVPGIVGMHLFNGRNLVIDANPSIGQGGAGPSLYISDPVTTQRTWNASTSTASWGTSTSWSAVGVPGPLWVAEVRNAVAANQRAVVSANSTVFQLTVGGTGGNTMSVEVQQGIALTTFGEMRIDAGGSIALAGGKLDAQFINIHGGALTGTGSVFVGSGPISGVVRNLNGRIEPGGDGVGILDITGDLSNLAAGTLEFDVGGKTAGLFDRIDLDRFAFLAGRLEVNLVNAGSGLFAPQVGDQFTLLTADEGVEGEFDQLQLPSGFIWDVDYLPTSVVLKVTGLGSRPGDFDRDGDVDGNDLAAFSSSFGNQGGLGGSDFLIWQRSFPSAGGGITSVPEPSAAMMAGLLLLFALGRKPKGGTSRA